MKTLSDIVVSLLAVCVTIVGFMFLAMVGIIVFVPALVFYILYYPAIALYRKYKKKGSPK